MQWAAFLRRELSDRNQQEALLKILPHELTGGDKEDDRETDDSDGEHRRHGDGRTGLQQGRERESRAESRALRTHVSTQARNSCCTTQVRWLPKRWRAVR
jgi:hypothetical protein